MPPNERPKPNYSDVLRAKIVPVFSWVLIETLKNCTKLVVAQNNVRKFLGTLQKDNVKTCAIPVRHPVLALFLLSSQIEYPNRRIVNDNWRRESKITSFSSSFCGWGITWPGSFSVAVNTNR